VASCRGILQGWDYDLAQSEAEDVIQGRPG
jgi:hypothetical protein